ncbi:CDP-diacylglycerol--serine O-phosphatidyltransferase [Elusimicrobiota bacterium]
MQFKKMNRITINKGIYILPSILTSINLSIGFLSIIFSLKGNFTYAAWAIIICGCMDILDGKLARLTKTTSRFGVEFDSLADLVSFGIAPALLMYQMILHAMDKPGLAIAVLYVLCGALRLARFNSKTEADATLSHFIGLPIPAAAGVLASFTLSYGLFVDGGVSTVKTIPILMERMPFFFKVMPITMLFLSLLMVSNVPYFAFKKFKADRPKPMRFLIFTVFCIVLIIAFPQNTLFIISIVYLLSGLTGYIIRYWRLKRALHSGSRLKNK